MATEKRLIDANALDDAVVISQHRNPHEKPGDRAMHNHEHLHFRVMISQAPTVDAVEVVYCDNCVNHGKCFPETAFRIANIEKPYCCVGKMDGDGNA